MRIKTKLALLSILTYVSLISVGFSSWLFTSPIEQSELASTITSDELIDSPKYISFSDEVVNGIILPKYYDTGYVENVDGNTRIVRNTSLKAYFTININQFNLDYETESNIDFVITFKLKQEVEGTDVTKFFINDIVKDDNNSDIVKHQLTHSLSFTPVVGYINDSSSITSTSEIVGNEYQVKFSLKNILKDDGSIKDEIMQHNDGKISFVVSLNFETEVGEYFKTNIYPLLKNTFAINAKLKGGNDNS